MSGPLGAESVTVLTAPIVEDDRFGSRHPDWDAATSVTVRGCSVQPVGMAGASRENVVDRQYTATHRILFAPWSAPIAATNRIVHDGTTYEVDGEPDRWRDLEGRGDHLEVAMKRLEG